jgi:hypothetical protein
MQTSDLVPSISIDNFLSQRDAMVERVRKARQLLIEVNDIAEAMPTTPDASSWYRLTLYTEPNRRDFISADAFENYIKAIDAACWARLLDLSGLRTFMDAQARKEWDENIDKCQVPELTCGNVEATFRELHAVRGDLFERGVVAVFKSLSWDYATNNPVMFGKRIILRSVYGTWGTGKHKYTTIHHEGANRLDDTMRVLCILDGKPEPDHRQGAYQRLSAAKLGDVVDFDGYFTSRGFKNGNGHLTFLKPALVDKMNQIIAKHYPGALPPGRD